MDYTQRNKKNIQEMLKTIKVNKINELFDMIPEKLISNVSIEEGKTEQEICLEFKDTARKNKLLTCFRGAGIYDHFIPSLVNEIIGRSEFWTSYTPYQAEASQGTLQAIFEYQSLICALTGLDVSNASLYDGATAVVEAILLALKIKNIPKGKILISSALNPEYIRTILTYLENFDVDIVFLKTHDGSIDIKKLNEFLLNDIQTIITIVIQSPNFFGIVEDMKTISSIVKKSDILFISVVNPLSLGVFCSPGEYGADIAVGEGQALGLPMNFGGSTLGFMAIKKYLTWKIPGRLVGKTIDKNGNPGFILTLQSREQHIRRERATSNICSNSSLNAIAACVFLSGWGKNEFVKLAKINIAKAKYAFNKIRAIKGFRAKFSENKFFFNEFVIETEKNINKINTVLLNNRILGPLNLSNTFLNKKDFRQCMLFCVTEQRTKKEIDTLIKILSSI